MNSPTILIIGKESVIGNYLYNNLKTKYKVFTTTRNYYTCNDFNYYLNLEDVETFNFINDKFTHCYICSSITNTFICNKHPKYTYNINVVNTSHLIDKLLKYGIIVNFFSSSYVFNSESEYGKQKAEIEHKLGNGAHIYRCTKIIHKDFKLFNTWISALKNNKQITCFKNVNISPITIDFLYKFCNNILENNITPNLWNLSTIDEISYYDAIIYLAIRLNLDVELIIPTCQNINNIYNSYLEIPKYQYDNIKINYNDCNEVLEWYIDLINHEF